MMPVTTRRRSSGNGAAVAPSARQELVQHLRSRRSDLRREWVESMTAQGLVAGLTEAEKVSESEFIYETVVESLETGRFESLEQYAATVASRGVLRAMSSEQVIGGFITLRSVMQRSLYRLYQHDMGRLFAALDVYEPVALKAITTVAMAFIDERENIVSKQQEAIRELSTPVLAVREGILIVPIIGAIDTLRARQLTEHLLQSIRDLRARAVVVDITGVPAVDSKVANHLVQTVDAARLLGASVVVTGISPEIARTLVTIGVDLTKMNTVCDLQGGIDEADRIVGYRVVVVDGAATDGAVP